MGVATHKIRVKIKFYEEVNGTMAPCNVDVRKILLLPCWHYCIWRVQCLQRVIELYQWVRVIVQKFNVERMGALKFEWPCLSERDYKWKSIFNTMLQHKLLKMKYNSGTSSFSQRNDLKCEMIEHQIRMIFFSWLAPI